MLAPPGVSAASQRSSTSATLAPAAAPAAAASSSSQGASASALCSSRAVSSPLSGPNSAHASSSRGTVSSACCRSSAACVSAAGPPRSPGVALSRAGRLSARAQSGRQGVHAQAKQQHEDAPRQQVAARAGRHVAVVGSPPEAQVAVQDARKVRLVRDCGAEASGRAGGARNGAASRTVRPEQRRRLRQHVPERLVQRRCSLERRASAAGGARRASAQHACLGSALGGRVVVLRQERHQRARQALRRLRQRQPRRRRCAAAPSNAEAWSVGAQTARCGHAPPRLRTGGDVVKLRACV